MTTATIDLPRPKILLLQADLLIVDAYVQRRLDPKRVTKMAREFDPRLLRTLVVNKRNERDHHVIDGQHRRAAMIEAGFGGYRVYCETYTGLTREQEAQAFINHNALTTKPNAVDTFRLRRLAGDPVAVEIGDVVDDFGLKIAFGKQVDQIPAVGALEWVHKRGGADLLRQTLLLLMRTWPNNRDAWDGTLVRGVATLLERHNGQLDREAFANKLAKDTTPAVVVGQARVLREATRRAFHLSTVEVLVGIYNKGRGGSSRIEAG